MHQTLSILVAALLSAVLLAGAEATEPLDKASLSMLEKRLGEIDTQLSRLANYGLGTGVGAIGYRSAPHKTPEQPEWIEINFNAPVALDEVILVPAIRRDTENGFQADGFPVHFRLVAGVGDNPAGHVVAEYTGADRILPRIAPFSIPCNGITASWIRIETVQLSLRAFDESYVLQLSEILAFSGGENVALHKPVKVPAKIPTENPGWDARFVVDGFMPYLMDAAGGSKSIAYLTPPIIDALPSLSIDLGQSVPLSRINLHAVDQSDTLPQAFIGDYGIPKHLRIEGANQPDFSDATPLADLHHETLYDMGPILMFPFPETPCRYVRFNVIEPSPTALYGPIPARIGFAEIEIFSRGRNLALGKSVSTSFGSSSPNRPLSNLTDGLNIYGSILPIHAWLNQLALRHELETERPPLMQELNRRYARQKDNLRRMGWLTILLASGTIITILIDRIIRLRTIHRIRERIAADLHDELGANLHAIGLLGDLAQSAKETPEKLDRILQRMRALTERTGAAARYCTNLLEADGLYEDLVEDMRKTSSRIMADLDHEIRFEGEEVLQKLRPRKRIDLFLFYKESLINIIRHSGATKVRTRLNATNKQLELSVTDNGHGLNGEVPASLKRRARLLGGQVSSQKAEPNGTRITLTFKLKNLKV